MLENVEKETKTSLKLLSESTMSTQLKFIIKQLSAEIEQAILDGDWKLAVKLSYYRHEFAKSHNNHDWYSPFIEIRKVRDILELLIKRPNGG